MSVVASRRSPLRRALPTLCALAWLAAVAAVYLAPALARGTKLGPFDLLGVFGLGAVPGAQPHNVVSSDQIQQMMPWTTLAWQQVHHGHLPLWNPFSGLGMPLAFNFQSAPFGLPALLSYLGPVRFSYTVTIIVKLLLAGTGAFFFGRALRLGVLASAFAGTIFETSGAFTGWLGWPHAGVLCWSGWMLGATLLVIEGRHRARDVALLAIVTAFAVYGGHPESVGLLAIAVVLFTLVLLLGRRMASSSSRGGPHPVIRPTVFVALGGVAGLALSAPLLLPGLDIVRQSIRTGSVTYVALPATSTVDLLFAGFHGFPISTSQYFGSFNYYEMAAYVGGIAAALALLAVLCRWRDPRVLAIVVPAVLMGVLAYVEPVARVINHIPVANGVVWNRSLVLVDMLLAMLAAFGLETVRTRGTERAVLWRLAAVVAVLAGTVGAIWIAHLHAPLPPPQLAEQASSFVWPAVGVGVAVGAVVLLLVGRLRSSRSQAGKVQVQVPGLGHAHAHTRAHVHTTSRATSASGFRLVACLALVAAETVFLLTAAPQLWGATPQVFTPTPAEAALGRVVGSGRVGFGACPTLQSMPGDTGILPNANVAYGVAEISVYDPVLPKTYFESWAQMTGERVVVAPLGNFCPSITTAALARHYGLAYVLEAPGKPGPAGTVPEGSYAGEGLFSVPGGGLATLEPAGSAPDSASAQVLQADTSDPSTVRLTVDPAARSDLYLHLTNTPGWEATIDGRPLALHSWATAMMRAQVPAGKHQIVLRYRPRTFDAGLAIAGVTAVALAVWMAAAHRRKRRARASGGTTSSAVTTSTVAEAVPTPAAVPIGGPSPTGGPEPVQDSGLGLSTADGSRGRQGLRGPHGPQ